MTTTHQVTPRKYAGMKIRHLVKENPCRDGSKAHAMVEAVLKAKTVDEAFATPIKFHKQKHYLASGDLGWCMHKGLIEIR